MVNNTTATITSNTRSNQIGQQNGLSSRLTSEHGPRPRAVRKTGRAGRSAAAKRPPLVIRKQRFPGIDSGEVETRRRRFERRAQSSRWLINDAMDGFEVDQETGWLVNPATGEIHTDKFIRPPRPARCGWALGGSNVSVHSDGNTAHFSGTERCSSIWACPVCSAVIRNTRAQEIQQAVEAHQAAGGEILFVTLTLRHKREDGLKMLIDGLLGSWQKLLAGSAWVGGKNRPGMKATYGIEGYIRATEVTYSQANGWHPHLHALFFLSAPLTELGLAAFGDELHSRWARFAHKLTGRTPDRVHGIDVQRLDKNGTVLAQYLSKVQDEGKARWGAGAELARGDLKNARAGGGLTPFQLLDPEDETGLTAGQSRALWLEYYKATKGRRAVTWSKGMKDRYRVEDLTDEQILEQTEALPVVLIIPGEVYSRVFRRDPGQLALVLEMARTDHLDVARKLLL